MLSLLKGDCLEVMKTLPSKSIDCFVCDLPYGCLTGGAGNEKAKRNERKRFIDGKDTGTILSSCVIGGCDWDVKIDLTQFWEQVKRLAKNDHTPVIMFCNTRFGNELINSNPKWFRYDLIWSKTNSVGFLHANKMPLRSHELIYIFAKKGANYKRININDYCPTSVITIANGKKSNHPTAKPTELYEWLLKRYCPENGTMLDPTAGSFNSCFTAKAMNLKAIGIEKDQTFFWKAVSCL
jgi:site-specific DNA-methyltransferase (adenine-specific)